MARGHVLAIRDPGDPHWSPKTTIFTPKTNLFSSATFQESQGPVILSLNCQMHLFISQPTSPVARSHVSAVWDPGDPHRSPQTTIFTPKTSLFSLAAFQKVRTSNSLSKLPNASFLLSTHLTHGKGPCISHLGPRGPPLEPPNNLERVLLVLTLSESG